MAQPAIQTSFASGEWAPKLRSRVDIQKYHAGAQLLRNFFVDYSGGGASTRQGTQFIAKVGANGARLVGFQPSANVSYVIEFGNFYARFYTNGAQVMSGGIPYQIATPFAASDLFPNPIAGNPGIKFVQDVTSLIICHPSYAPQILTIVTATNWSITAINFGTTIATPTNLAVVSSDSSGTTWYTSYEVTAVDVNGQESAPTTAVTFAGTNGPISNTTSPTAFTVTWTAVAGAVSYNVYKAAQGYKSTVPAGSEYGFIGNVTAQSFLDSTPGVAPDFSQTPPITQNPFLGAGVQSYTVTNAGTYTSVPTVTITGGGGSGATAGASLGVTVINQTQQPQITGPSGSGSPVGATQLNLGNGVILNVTSATLVFGQTWNVTGVSIANAGSVTGAGTTAPTTGHVIGVTNGWTFNASLAGTYTLTWGVTQVLPIQDGSSYTSVPTVGFSAGAAAATAVLGPASAGNPGVPGFLQERLWLASQPQSVQTINISQPNSFFNFNTTFPAEDDNGISATIISEQLNAIKWMVSVPAGMLCGTNKGAWLVNGGSGISTMNPITPSNITAQPQAFNGANDLRPIKINYDLLFGTYKGNYVRDMAYNIYAGIFTGADISVLSNHLFFNYYIVDWAWAEEPFKTLWATRSDGVLLSLAYVKEQELIGWAHHDTNGQFLSVASVAETLANGNVVDAVYAVVQRVINGTTVQYVERFKDRYFTHGYFDSWSVDCALQTVPNTTPANPLTITGNVTSVGNAVTLVDATDAPFTSGMVGWQVHASDGGMYVITAYTSTSQVSASVMRVPNYYNQYTGSAFAAPGNLWALWQPVTTVSGLTQLENTAITGVADGVVVSGTVSNTGTFTLPNPACKITLGLAFTPQLQTLPLDLGEPTVQGKRKKITGITLRVADTLGLQAGTTFANAVTMKDFQIGNVATTSTGSTTPTGGPIIINDLVAGDGRTIIDQTWQEAGSYCIQQNLPYPATILGAMPEIAVGDTK